VGLWGFGAHYAIVPELGVLAGIHQGFSPVAPGQSPGVKPETSVNYEFGLRFNQSSSATLVEAVGFVSDYANLVGECTFSSGCGTEQLDRQYNAGQVLVAGLELVAAHRFEFDGGLRVPLRLAYTFTHTSFRTAFTSENPQLGVVAVGDELPYVPAHQVALQAGVGSRRWGVDVSCAVVDEMRERAGQGAAPASERTDLLVLLDVVGRVEFLSGMELYTKIDNLLMQDTIVSRRPFGARSNKPFSLSVGLKLHL
jgi:Fe(3+) dicitrate transport protein